MKIKCDAEWSKLRIEGTSHELKNIVVFFDRQSQQKLEKTNGSQFYKKIDKDYVKCNICEKKLKHSNNTTNMRQHLLGQHKDSVPLLAQEQEKKNKVNKRSSPSDETEDNNNNVLPAAKKTKKVEFFTSFFF